MTRHRGFAEILIEKALEDLDPTTKSTTSSTASYQESVLEPWGLSYLYHHNQTHVWKSSKYQTPPRPAHKLNKEQDQAFQTLIKLSGQQLPKGFTARQLRSAYRQGLLKNHPDHGGFSVNLTEVKKCYEILYPLVKPVEQ